MDTVLGVSLVGVGAAGVVLAPNGLGDVLIPSAITGYGRTADCRRTVEALPSGPARAPGTFST